VAATVLLVRSSQPYAGKLPRYTVSHSSNLLLIPLFAAGGGAIEA
jgi:hypothetical protein